MEISEVVVLKATVQISSLECFSSGSKVFYDNFKSNAFMCFTHSCNLYRENMSGMHKQEELIPFYEALQRSNSPLSLSHSVFAYFDCEISQLANFLTATPLPARLFSTPLLYVSVFSIYTEQTAVKLFDRLAIIELASYSLIFIVRRELVIFHPMSCILLRVLDN